MGIIAEYKSQVNALHVQADAYARYFGLEGERNGAWDAFRHAYASAELTRVHGAFTAKLLGDAHEIDNQFNDPNWKYQEKNMDLWNNAAGRKMGENSSGPADTARRVMNAMGRDSLITDPEHDGRQSGGNQPAPDDSDPKACCDECGAADTFPPPPWPPSPSDQASSSGPEGTVDIPIVYLPPIDISAISATAPSELAMSSEWLQADAGSAMQRMSSESLPASTESSKMPASLASSIDGAMATIANTHVDSTQGHALTIEHGHVIEAAVVAWTDHREEIVGV